MAQATHHRFSFAEYIQLDDDSGVKHEYANGHVYAMAGRSPEHAGVTANVSGLLREALRGKSCRVFSSDLRVRTQATGLATYADVTVICRAVELDTEDPTGHTALNPIVLVEVLSPSTEDYDRGEKLGNYKQVPSLREVLLVAHDRHEVEIVRREDDGSWSRHIAVAGGVARVTSLGCELAVYDMYHDPLR